MAKKVEIKVLVDCKLCQFSNGIVDNCMLECSNKLANPKGHKVGSWLKECRHYKKRKNA